MDHDTEALYWLCLSLANRRYNPHLVLSLDGGIEAVFLEEARHVAEHLGVVGQSVAKWRRILDSGAAEQAMERAAKLGQWVMTYPQLPERLKHIAQPPSALFGRGRPLEAVGNYIAVVGSRAASLYGIRWADTLAADLARLGVVVVSGGALGIDAASHEGALRAGGLTVSVAGCGLDVDYPKGNRDLFAQIEGGGGCRISEYPPGTHPKAGHFPKRNRLISGLSLGIVVVEAASRSGALSTARLASEQGREVFVIPGPLDSPVSEGCHQLIRQGATLITGAEQIVEQISGQLVQMGQAPGSPLPELSRADRAIIATLSSGALSTDEIITRTGLEASQVAGRLLTLEIAGVVANPTLGLYRLGHALRAD